ncbi:MAG: Lrp/AsnC family transcriptional regulator [Kiloniellaceae bacterium]
MRRVKLDRIDLHILKDLQDDGRITNVELARRAGISAPPCLRRVRALEEAGFVRGYHAELNGEALGFEVMFFALVGLDSQSESVLTAFERMIAKWPEVRECHMARGPSDFVLRIVARNTAHENELTTQLTSAPHVVTVQTIQVIRTSKDLAGVPIEAGGPQTDDERRASSAASGRVRAPVR